MFENTLVRVLKGAGADLVGIGALRSVPDCPRPTGIAVAVRVPSSIVKDLRTEPTAEYYDAYYELNAKLNGIVETGARFWKSTDIAHVHRPPERWWWMKTTCPACLIRRLPLVQD